MTAQPSSQAEREDVAREVLASLGDEHFAAAVLHGDSLDHRMSFNGATVLRAMLAFSDREHATPRYTYDVTWSRSDGERFTCPNLTPKLVTARIIQAIKTSGSITIHAVEGHPATPCSMPEEVVEAAMPMDTAPRDGTMVRLLVDYTDGGGPLDDAQLAWTIGFNGFEDHGVDEWKFAGWCWTHDHFTQGSGTPVGWLPWSNPSTGGDEA